MSDAPLFSVVIAAYNAEEYLPATMASVLDQDVAVDDYEVIVVDDGSTDSTGEILDAVAARDGRVRVIHLPANVGRSGARNAGIEAMRGEWMVAMDADDLWTRRRLAAFAEAVRAYPGHEVIFDDLIEFTPEADGTITLGHRYSSRVTWKLGRSGPVPIEPFYIDRDCAMQPIVRRSLIERRKLRYPEGLSAGEDLLFGLEAIFARDVLEPVRVAEVNYYYRVGHSSRAANMAESAVLINRRAVEATGNPTLKRLVDKTLPGKVWTARRADGLGEKRGRSAER
ncbi:MAG: glycosyltransferase family 2 protein, partial [Actinobacteria bacterium]|nr:glycosyltransferase family 2 protein [Actinomycetota bacterium]